MADSERLRRRNSSGTCTDTYRMYSRELHGKAGFSSSEEVKHESLKRWKMSGYLFSFEFCDKSCKGTGDINAREHEGKNNGVRLQTGGI